METFELFFQRATHVGEPHDWQKALVLALTEN